MPLKPSAEDLEVMNNLEAEIDDRLTRLQKVKDAAIPDRSRQGAILQIGEVLLIRGGKFRVERISGKRVYLESLPS